MRRISIPELLDNDTWTPVEVEDSLADVQMFNVWFGGISTMAKLLSSVATERQLTSVSWLDVAGARGDLVSCTTQKLAGTGIRLEPVILDLVSSHLGSQYASVCGDALRLPFRDNSFDVVGCCLFLHHLEPEQVTEFVAESLRVARHAVLINDLVRDPLLLALSYAGYAIYRSRLSRHDGPASVRRAHTVSELRSMLQTSSASKIEVSRFHPFRVGGIVWKDLSSKTNPSQL